MKSKRIYKEYTYHLFNPLTNEIEIDRVITVNRKMTTIEKKKYLHFKSLAIFYGFFSLVIIITGFMFPILSSCNVLSRWFKFSIFIIVFSVFTLRFWFGYSDKCAYLLNKEFPAVGFEEYDRAYKDSEEYQKDCAEVWRAAHPLEEKIRQAQQSGNCVDIAKLVRYCGADLVDKFK